MKNTSDMTQGNPLRIILIFSLPILLGNLFQQFYNIVDTTVVGHVLGEDSLAAVGASSAIYSLIVSFANGMANGFSILGARLFGAKNEQKLRRAFAMSILLTLIISVVLTIVGLLILMPLLRALNTPDDIIMESYSYIVVILSFLIITMFYNVLAGFLQAVGNSKIPLIFLIIASIVNVMLDILFVRVIHMGVRGAAIATVCSQVLSLILCITYIVKKCPFLWLKKSDFVIEKKLITELFSTGLSMALMFSIVNLGTVILQSAINPFGEITIAAHTAARKLSGIFMLPITTITVAASTFVSQNYGAGQKKRITTGVKDAFFLGFIWSAIAIFIVFCFGRLIIIGITGSDDSELIGLADRYLKVNLPFYPILVVLCVLRNVLQSLGLKIIPLISSSIELFGKVFAVYILVPSMAYFGVIISEPIIWIICAVLLSFTYIYRIRKLMRV